ncbi:uncharacterized protein CcaverHIS019_0405590 [Cutaneotrichosporon cavernicola]|uniref:Maintenance of telomere capping protein 1 n=1 Tax=Cutaneotrichosporon cavernicola TaxID=279322 RepID=A0AA48QVV1_9TREE|nr:uncharacterized protein CcaverHIS019_0405590 [Cutaneotrichosporon cavernicola]BEI91739.1 hypothetical protein CcaverHIS019_0405590 [Cutaneotrichosporon cavernicola]BEI99512.1 hypothetical protein CcaverHIS631_0405550 [Cutaneotrichosporon cavernicola]BEJ07290.1 hypothetical protein CcaverHIS641_0405590 [Cutaneotrichosporon cavernicola]
MPPKKTKAEEALAFLDNLDNLDAETGPADAPGSVGSARPSTDSANRKDEPPQPAPDSEAADALAFLEAQINQKRAPLSKPSSSTPRTESPALGAPGTPAAAASKVASASPAPAALAHEEQAAASSGWGWGGGSFWSSATSAIQSAQRVADEQYRKVRTEGVSGIREQIDQLHVGGVDVGKLRKDAETRLGGLAKNVGNIDLDKLRQDILTQANSTFTTLINTVAPPISAHETIELWLSHPMVGYEGVEGVVYRAWMTILEQTESGELVVVWSPPDQALPTERTLNPITGWHEGWRAAQDEVEAAKGREDKKPRGRAREQSGDVPVTTIPVFLHLQPVLAPLPFPEPALQLSTEGSQATVPQHLYFIVSLQDPVHGLQFTTVSQPSPGDWLEVEYDKSDWVEERLVEVLKTSIEIVAQDYVSTRMALKPSVSVPATPRDVAAGQPIGGATTAE